MPKKSELKAKFQMDPLRGVPARIYDVVTRTRKMPPRQAAESLLKNIAGRLKINPDLSQLKFDQVKQTLLGSHVLFQQYHDGMPISDAWVRVDIDKQGQIYNLQNDLVPDTKLANTPTKQAVPTVDQAQAEKLAADDFKQSLGSTAAAIVSSEHVLYQDQGVPKAAWKIVLASETPRAQQKTYIDAASGAILGKYSLLKSANGQGRVFDPNPVVALGDTSLRDTGVIPDTAYRDVTLLDLPASGLLDGPFVNTGPSSNRVQRANLDFRLKRTDRGFKEVMVYFHLDRVQRYIQGLGLNNVLNRSIGVDVAGRSDDNSDYSPVTKQLTFGTGGVDDAEDAEVVLHEYGHAIQDDQVPGFGQEKEGKAMGEGFGDYWAGSFFADSKPARFRNFLASWDATAYSADDPPNLRRLDSTKKYPRDMQGEEHSDGEIWSACLWEIRAALGRRSADQLILAHHFHLTRNSKFEDAANSLLTTDGVLNAGHNAATIRDVFTRRGIFASAKMDGKRAGDSFASLLAPPRPAPAARRTPSRPAVVRRAAAPRRRTAHA